jgi:hypothetical protein
MKFILIASICFSVFAFGYTNTDNRKDYLDRIAQTINSTGTAVLCGDTEYKPETRHNKIGNINSNLDELQRRLNKRFKIVGSQLEQTVSINSSQMCLVVQ